MAEKHNLSPIEHLFALALIDWEIRLLGTGREMKFVAQYEIAPSKGNTYRIDFVLLRADSKPMLAIELDGHDFHEKSKEQVRNDKIRERAIVATGLRVLRFSGSEIWADAFKCAEASICLYYNIINGKV